MQNWYKKANMFKCKECGAPVEGDESRPQDRPKCPSCGVTQDYACYSCGERHPFASPTEPDTEEKYDLRQQKHREEYEAKK